MLAKSADPGKENLALEGRVVEVWFGRSARNSVLKDRVSRRLEVKALLMTKQIHAKFG